jgi:RNA methyltransferase, TrmH family
MGRLLRLPESSGHELGVRSGRVAAARKLLRRSARRQLGLVLLEGHSAVSAAIEAGQVREVFASSSAAQRHADLLSRLQAAGIAWHLVSEDAAAALSETVTPQGLVAVAPLPQADLRETLRLPPRLPGRRIVAVLVEPRDPGNAGTVIRTADAAGVDCVILAGESVDPWSGKCIRASAGSVLHLPVIDGVTVEETAAALRGAGCRVIAADGHGTKELQETGAEQFLAGDHAWLFGNEAHGLPRSLVRSADISIGVPVYGRAESLNLAAAAAVCLYESARVARSLSPEAQG